MMIVWERIRIFCFSFLTSLVQRLRTVWLDIDCLGDASVLGTILRYLLYRTLMALIICLLALCLSSINSENSTIFAPSSSDSVLQHGVTPVSASAHFGTCRKLLWPRSLAVLDSLGDLIIIELLLNGFNSPRSWEVSSDLLRTNVVGVTTAFGNPVCLTVTRTTATPIGIKFLGKVETVNSHVCGFMLRLKGALHTYKRGV